MKWKLIFSALLAALILAACIKGHCNPPPVDVAPFNPAAAADSGYKPARVVKPADMPVIKPVAGSDPVIAGSGFVVRPDTLPAWPDTLPVEVSVIEGGGDTWVGVWVAGQPVHWEQLDVAKRDINSSDWQAVAEVASVCDRPDFGAGAAWTPVTLWGTETGLAATIDLNRVIDTAPDWGAVSGHVSRRYGPVHLGAHVGYRFGQDAGLHLAVCVGVGLDL